jgi:hypothetical protein
VSQRSRGEAGGDLLHRPPGVLGGEFGDAPLELA